MTRISSWIGKHPTASLVIFMFAAFALGNAGQEITRINIRFALMTSEMAYHPLGVFPTLNGQPYADYPSLYNLLSFLTSCGGRWIDRFTLALPTMLLGCYVVAMTAKTTDLLKPGAGFCAALFSLLSFEYLNIFMAFSIDLPVAAAALTIVWSLLKFDFGSKVLPIYLTMLILAFTVRGPLGIILCGAVAAGVIIGGRRWKALLIYGVAGAAVAAGCLMLSYWAIVRQGGVDLWRTAIEWQVDSRIGNRGKSPFAYLYYFTGPLCSFLPVTIFTVATLAMKRRELGRRELTIPLLWALIPMLLLSIPGGKHLRYMTPLLPAFAILAAIGFVEADDSPAGRFIDLMTSIMDALILPAGLALIATATVLSFYLPADKVSLYAHLAAALTLLFVLYFLLRRRPGREWKLIRSALAMTLLVGVVFTSGDAMWENSSLFVGKTERLLREQRGRLYLYDLSPDHDALKVMYNVSPETRRNAVTIHRFRDEAPENLKKMFPVIPPEEALKTIRPCDVIVLHRKKLAALRAEAAKFGLKTIEIDQKGRLGHKPAVAVRLEPEPSE